MADLSFDDLIPSGSTSAAAAPSPPAGGASAALPVGGKLSFDDLIPASGTPTAGPSSTLYKPWHENLRNVAGDALSTLNSTLNPASAESTQLYGPSTGGMDLLHREVGRFTRVPRAVGAVGELLASPFTAAVKTAAPYVASGMASGVQAVGEPIAKQLNPNVVLPTHEEVTARAIPDVERALGLSMPAKGLGLTGRLGAAAGAARAVEPVAAAGAEAGAAPVAAPPSAPAAAVERPNLGVRLLPPEAPHVALETPPEAVGAPGARRSVGAAGTPTIGPLADLSPAARTKLGQVIDAEGFNPYTLDQRLSEMSQHEFLGEVSDNMRSEMSALNAMGGGARNEISTSVRQRAGEAVDRLKAIFDQAFGALTNREQWRRVMQIDRAEGDAPIWGRFQSTRIAPTPEINALMPRLQSAGALRAANTALGIEGIPASAGFEELGTGQFISHDPNIMTGGAPVPVRQVPTAAAFQAAKEHLDGLIERAMADPGGANDARRLTGLKNDLVNAIDNHPDPNVAGLWKEARQTHEGPTRIMKAMDLGERALTGNVHDEKLPFLTSSYSADEWGAFKAGMRGYLEDVLKRAGSSQNRNVINTILAGGNETKLRWALGDKAADELISAIQHEERMHAAPNQLIGNSMTANRTERMKGYVTAPGAVESAITGQGNLTATDLLHGVNAIPGKVLKAGTKLVAGKLAERQAAARAAADAKVQEELARIYTLQGAERDAVLKELVGEIPSGPNSATSAPLQRVPTKTTRTGRMMSSKPLAIGKENAILQAGANKVHAAEDARMDAALADVAREGTRYAPNYGNAESDVAMDAALRGVKLPPPPWKRAAGGRVETNNIDRSPTEAQKAAGNYAKDHVRIHGLDLTIENPKGGERSGVGRDGKRWSIRMPCAYGYIKRTEGADGDHVDVYLGLYLKAPKVFVVDQMDAETGAFDEHKCFLGFGSKRGMLDCYRRAFSDGKAGARLGNIAVMTVEEFKDWLKGDTSKPLDVKAKRSHASVSYVAKSNKPNERCGLCAMFVPPQHGGPGCTGVVDPIAAAGWCKRFGRGRIEGS